MPKPKSKTKSNTKPSKANNKSSKKINIIKKTGNKVDGFLNRRPHRSFRLTRRRDYNRSLKLPGYIVFTKYVLKTIWDNRKILGYLALVYASFTVLMVGIASQGSYQTLSNALDTTSGSLLDGLVGEISKAGLLFISSATGGISQTMSESQQIYSGLIALLTWMTTIWLLRNILAGNKVKLRDGLYSSASPLLATFIVFIVFIIQLLPLALALIAFGAAAASGLLANGAAAMLFWFAAALFSALSLYWITSTFFAMVIVTLPGMYPFKALKTAGDMVVGRRLRIFYRMLWMTLITILSWSLIMIPTILLDKWVKSIWPAIDWMPTVPIVLLILISVSIIWISSYIYLLYRKVVADDAEPA